MGQTPRYLHSFVYTARIALFLLAFALLAFQPVPVPITVVAGVS